MCSNGSSQPGSKAKCWATVSLPLGLPRAVSTTASLMSNLASGPERIVVGFEAAAAAITSPELKPNARMRMGTTARIPLRMAFSSFTVVNKPRSQGRDNSSLTA
jgi:hypothetical protein